MLARCSSEADRCTIRQRKLDDRSEESENWVGKRVMGVSWWKREKIRVGFAGYWGVILRSFLAGEFD